MPVITNQVQIGTNATSSNNFVLQTNADGTAKIARGIIGATTQDILTIDAAGMVSMNNGYKNLTLGTPVATTSGTAVDFTNIPSWVKRITVMFNEVSTNGTSTVILQLGSGSIDATSTYKGVVLYVGGTNAAGGANNTTGFQVNNGGAASVVASGIVTLNLFGSNTWVQAGNLGRSDANYFEVSGGSKVLSGVLDRIRLTTANGTDAFDAGSVNIMYEG